ncbi:hypothetical protein AB0H82_19860 [Streptomyces sp. NPDC050732]|uniref:hypothetical protein n=1 Tax=Streptomyces sp. NPDC050732 TaxID=3154632 RepID=UPI00343520D4
MNEPVNRTILLFDIEQFGKRDDVEQAFLRRLLYDVADQTLVAAGVSETARLRADRGDSVMELIDARVPVSAVLKTLLAETPALLHNKNRLISNSAQMRLRIVLSTGYVAVDDLNGWVGSDLNHACRLLDAAPLREALRGRKDHSVLCVSDGVYQGVVRHGPLGVRPEEFHRITVEAKEGPTVAWLHGETGAAPASPPPSEEAAVNGSSQEARYGTTNVGRDQYGVSGGHVQGDIHYRFSPGDDR